MRTDAWRVLWLDGHKALICLCCNRFGFAPQDIAQRYCGHCHRFLADVPADYVPEQPRNGVVVAREGSAGDTERWTESLWSPLLNSDDQEEDALL
jgi:hypothetical protein